MAANLPETIDSVEQLLDVMTTPTDGVRKAVEDLGGEFLVLGAAGKMGPSLCEMLVRAGASKVIAVDLFPNPAVRDALAAKGCQTVTCDLLDAGALDGLPDCGNVLIMTGFKFGASGNPTAMWAMNTLLPARIVGRFAGSRLLLMSSGNVYRFVPTASGGATETDATEPVGEYAQSRLGGERVAQYVADRQGTKLVIVRLFYSVEMRYGIIHDLASAVRDGKPIDLAMGYVNQIWQGDANAYLVQFLTLADSPARTINITGPEILSVRELAAQIGQRMGREPVLEGTEADTALLGNSDEAFKRFGKPRIAPDQIVQWIVPWVQQGRESLGKPTKYERRDGKF